ncbi:anhydro-N-acetylmuramic acid kinase [Oceaniglobus trochenteri]|uniref:anhydro-N-acetylmuramic acid kinase n=1 Tax=Oceaniglobus trochenteri TaxID=2763260 RepID=UPI001CFF6F8E|nr:anhydro-N-acetylmuramic acid kinase [Oceaniglobus trochenteri]
MNDIWAAGLMTGTVLDGNIDVALIRTDGEGVAQFGAYRLVPYPDDLRALLVETLDQARTWAFDGPEPAIFAEAEARLTLAQAQAVRLVADENGPGMANVGVVGFHGQSVLHRAPEPGRRGQTRQLGDGRAMAQVLGCPVVYDFRSADMAAGGQGAPLSGTYHAALLRSLGRPEGTAVLNLGGVANVSWLGPDDRLIAFDTGPANAPINDFVAARGLGEMDRDGALARSGSVDEARLAKALDHPYMTAPFPKSLDRFDFGTALGDGLSDADGAATLTAFSAAAVGRALDLLPIRPTRLIVCGGGRRNPALMEAIAQRAGVEAVTAETVGWRGDAIEAECFALLAVRSLRDLPISFPDTTGVPQPMTGGRIARP